MSNAFCEDHAGDRLLVVISMSSASGPLTCALLSSSSISSLFACIQSLSVYTLESDRPYLLAAYTQVDLWDEGITKAVRLDFLRADPQSKHRPAAAKQGSRVPRPTNHACAKYTLVIH